MTLEIELSNFQNMPGGPGFCEGPSAVILFGQSFGAASFDYTGFIQCDPRPGALVGAQVDVTVRVVRFGIGGSPATTDVAIRGETEVPTGTLTTAVVTNLTPQTVFLNPSKDTVIYRSNPAASNGLGAYLWAGSVSSIAASRAWR